MVKKKLELEIFFFLQDSPVQSKGIQNYFTDFRTVFNVAKVSLKLWGLERNVFEQSSISSLLFPSLPLYK